MNRWNKRFFSLMLMGCMLLPSLTPALAAEGNDTVYIYTAEELMNFVQSCSYDAWSQGKTVSLERDVSLGGVDFLPAASFGGVFEGNGHTVSDMSITRSVSPAGFFGILQEGAEIRDLKIAGTVSPGGSGEKVGGIAGINRGSITDCSFTGTVEGSRFTGGIVGDNAVSGIVRHSAAQGGVFGKSMTGGVAGRNAGSLSSCSSNAYVNTNTIDPAVSLSDLDLDLRSGPQTLMSPDTFNVATDSGGVAGFSDGLILSCQNYGVVGYQHIGYNVGGIAGRNGGHISGCVNTGKVYGRRGVGGVVGVAEPDIIRNVSESALEKLRRELDTMNSLVEKTTRDADSVSSTVSARLTAVGNSVDAARDRAEDLTDTLTNYLDGTMAEINRGSEILDGAIDRLKEVTAQARQASESLTDALDATRDALDDLAPAGDAGMDALRDLGDMAADLQTAADLLGDSFDKLSAGLDELRGSDALDALKQGRDGLAEIRQGIFAAADGLSAADAAMDAIRDELGGPGIPDIAVLKDSFQQIKDGFSQTEAGLRSVRQGLEKLEGGSSDAIDSLRQSLSLLEDGFAILSDGRHGDQGGVFFYLSRAMENLESAMSSLVDTADALQGSVRDLRRTVSSLRDASQTLTAALEEAEKLVNYLRDQERLSFADLGTQADPAADHFYDSLRDLSHHLELLNGEAKTGSDTLTEDLRGVNRQFTRLMDVLLDTAEDVGNASASDKIEDTSDENIDAVTRGKVFLSTNRGTVAGDIDVGGVAGAMDIYNDLNPEEDDPLTLSSLLHSRYQLKCVLQDCVNTGEVTGKRDNVGAVCGDSRLGVISGCLGCGRAQSEGGDNVGGIAGYGDNIIRKCWARCSLSGQSYVGGIVGRAGDEASDCVVDRCRSLVEITDCEQHAGAIAGVDAGTFTDNLFVSDTLAGLDRVSYRDRARPVSYEELLKEDGLPREFRSFLLTFRTEDAVVKSLRFNYGDSLEDSVFPAVPEKTGMYGKWDREELRDLRFDATVTALYSPYVTALPSALTRSAARPVFFVTGSFDNTARLDASPEILPFDPQAKGFWQTLRAYRRDVLEQWQLSFPDDGEDNHTVRYLPTEAGPGQLEVYVLRADTWERLDAGRVGSYLEFQAPGQTADITILSTATPWWVWVLLSVPVLGLALFALTFLRQKKASQRVLTEEEKARAAKRAGIRKRIRIILLIFVLAMSIAMGAVLRFAPQVTTGMELYRLLRGYAERDHLAMRLEISTQLNGESFRTGLDIQSADYEGKRLLRIDGQGISLYYRDGVILLENGKAFRLDGVLPNYSNLLPHLAGIYRVMDISSAGLNGVKTYHATVQGEAAQTLLELLLPQNAGKLPATDGVGVDVLTTDGELTAIQISWNGGESSVSAELTFPPNAAPASLPQSVSAALQSGEYQNAPTVSEDARRLLAACANLAARESLAARVKLSANCGPVLLSEDLTWQLTHRYGKDLSRVEHRGGALWFTGDAACLDSGISASLGDATRMDAGALLALTYGAVLLGEPTCDPIADGFRYSITLDADAMTKFANLIAPETGSMPIGFDSGSITLTVRDGTVAALSIRCRGNTHIVLTDVTASVSAQINFERYAAFPEVPGEVLTALGL